MSVRIRLFVILLAGLGPGLPAADPPKLPAGVIDVAAAAAKLGEEVTLQMAVKSSSKTKDGKRVFLNSEADYKNEKNFTIMLTGKILTEGKWKDKKPEDFKDKTIRVKGKVIKYKEKLEIEIDDEKKLEIVE